jgi:hypothetical protein
MNEITISPQTAVVARARLPPNHCVAMTPASSGPAAVSSRPMLFVTASAEARTDAPSSGKNTALPESTPNTPNPTKGSSHMYIV